MGNCKLSIPVGNTLLAALPVNDYKAELEVGVGLPVQDSGTFDLNVPIGLVARFCAALAVIAAVCRKVKVLGDPFHVVLHHFLELFVGIFGYKAQLNWMFRRAEN